MRILAGCFLVAAAGVVFLQSSRDFHKQYGEPDRERFAARPGISLTVEYGSDHLACQALTEPPQSLIQQEEPARLMSSEGVSEILEEVAPISMRGKEINTGYVSKRGCNEWRMMDYENVSIMRSRHTCDHSSPDQDVRTSITFKRDTCPNQIKRPQSGSSH